jgi:hypothetical protein
MTSEHTKETATMPIDEPTGPLVQRRQDLTATTFVELVDTLVDNFDVIEVLTVLTSRTVELLAAAAAGILLADEQDTCG